ncbi:AAA family ATPase [Sphingobium yanoikuyae]|uniref:AAA family ATPase n=1 Tax=Sphingobium yanoikuyae TaxID=13690 RepID=UPI0028AB46DA|nr:AAA family ATPase [Sphingobium yanoikuyae]
MTLAQDITRHFGGEWHGSYGAFPAPGHSADDRGVTVKDADGGRDVLFNSFNGANWREIKDECRRIGLLPEWDRANDNGDRPRETGHYEYADGDGTVLYRTVRIEQVGKRKRFQAQRPDGRGGWINGMGDAPRVPYRLPEIRAAIERATVKDQDMPTVYLVEGERKADKLAGWGFLATAVAFGCKGWRKDYADALAGCAVIILPDNDEEGRGFADKASADLQGAGCSVRVIDLPGLPPKGDIMDWSGSADDLRALVKKVEAPAVETFAVADLGAWASVQPTPKAFIMAGFVPARELTLATGAGGANKSTFGQQLATCCAAGVPMLGIDVMQGPALYITAEDDDDRLHWMQTHICRALAVDMASMAGKLHLVSLRGRLGNELATFDAEGKLRPAPSFQLLKATIEQTGSSLVVLDNAAHLFAGNENDRQQVTAFVNLLYSLCRDLGVTIILVAHSNKAGDSYSGSTAWLNAVRSQIVLQRPEGAIDPDERLLTLGKANYARQGEELRFRWHEFALRLDRELPDDTRAQLADAAVSAGANAAFLECLRARNEQGDGRQVGPSSGPNYAPSQFEGMPQAKGFKKEALKRAMDRLYALGRIKSETVFDRKAKRDKTVIVEAEETSHNVHNARTTAAQHTPTTPHNDGTTGGQHTPIYKYIPGAASQAAAPQADPHTDLDDNGDTIGWHDK